MNLLTKIPVALTTTATQALVGEGHSHKACGVYFTVCIHLNNIYYVYQFSSNYKSN
jgi:hypothetical protein